MKPRVFIGSSTKGLPVAELAQRELAHDCEPILWSQAVFRTNNVPIEDLKHSLEEYDFAVFILLPEDPMQIRDTKTVGVRDNVLFELGLFLGKLGRKRIFIIGPENNGPTNLHLPSDLSGVTLSTYDPKASNLQASVGQALYDAKYSIRTLGRVDETRTIIYDMANLKKHVFKHHNGCYWKDDKPSSPRSDPMALIIHPYERSNQGEHLGTCGGLRQGADDNGSPLPN